MGLPPIAGWFIRKNPIKIDDLGVHPFMETSISRPSHKMPQSRKIMGKVLSSYHISFLWILQESRYRYTMSCNLPMYWQLNGRKTLSLLNNQPVGKRYGHFTDE